MLFPQSIKGKGLVSAIAVHTSIWPYSLSAASAPHFIMTAQWPCQLSPFSRPLNLPFLLESNVTQCRTTGTWHYHIALLLTSFGAPRVEVSEDLGFELTQHPEAPVLGNSWEILRCRVCTTAASPREVRGLARLRPSLRPWTASTRLSEGG